jgi:hypothetical protein
VLVVLQDGRQIEGELHTLTGRYEVGGVVFEAWEIEEVAMTSARAEKLLTDQGAERVICESFSVRGCPQPQFKSSSET